MGRFKEQMIDIEFLPCYVKEEKFVCADMFPYQRYLREDIQNKGQAGVCSYSGKMTNVLPLTEIVRRVYDEFERIFEDPANEIPFESGGDWDELNGSGFHKEGAGYLLPNSRSIMTTEEALEEVGFMPASEELFDDVASSFNNNAWVLIDAFDLTPDERLHDNWEDFSVNVIKETVAGKDYDVLYDLYAPLLSYLADVIASNLHALKRTLPQETILYRCVNYLNVPEPLTAKWLWAPPADKASAQRMSRKGQSRLYVSFDKETPLSEAVVNTQGEKKCLGKFKLEHSLDILDFSELPLPYILNCPDVFAFNYFNEFAKAITQEVGENEKEKYVPTQMMRDMIESHFIKQGIMGIKYRSVKGNGTTNLVLFLDDNMCPNYIELLNTEVHRY